MLSLYGGGFAACTILPCFRFAKATAPIDVLIEYSDSSNADSLGVDEGHGCRLQCHAMAEGPLEEPQTHV